MNNNFSSKLAVYFWLALYLISSAANLTQGKRFKRDAPTTMTTLPTSSVSSTIADPGTNVSATVKVKEHENSANATSVDVAEGLKKVDSKLDNMSSTLNELNSKYAPGAALRGLYVFIGLSAVVVLYIAAKVISLKRNRMKMRKYGLLSNVDDVEMAPLGADDDEDDTTLFDANHHTGH